MINITCLCAFSRVCCVCTCVCCVCTRTRTCGYVVLCVSVHLWECCVCVCVCVYLWACCVVCTCECVVCQHLWVCFVCVLVCVLYVYLCVCLYALIQYTSRKTFRTFVSRWHLMVLRTFNKARLHNGFYSTCWPYYTCDKTVIKFGPRRLTHW